MAFSRHLSVGEIVAQAHHVERSLRASHGDRLRNIVMMGMGEPMANFEAVMEALEILTDNRGLNIGPARMAISTVGHIPGTLKLAALLQGMDAHVNLIPLNPTEGFEGQAPEEASVRTFQQIIQDAGLPSTVRQRRGIDLAAGCGQLKSTRSRAAKTNSQMA